MGESHGNDDDNRIVIFGIGLAVLLFLFLIYNIISTFVFPAIKDNEYDSSIILSKDNKLKTVARIIVAIEDYKKSNGSYPKNITYLVPDFIDKIPENFYTYESKIVENYYSTKGAYYIQKDGGKSYELRFFLEIKSSKRGNERTYEECFYPYVRKWSGVGEIISCEKSNFQNIDRYINIFRKK